MAAAATQPTISSPTQLVSQHKTGVTALASSSRHVLQATPDSSLSTGYGLSIGSAYKIGSNGVRRARGLAIYASIDQGIVVFNPSTQTAIASHTFSPSLHPITAPLVVQSASQQSTVICLAPRNQDSSAEVHVWTRKRATPKDSLSEDVHHRSEEISKSARSLHPLASGGILVHHSDGSFSIIDDIEKDTLSIQSHPTPTSRHGAMWTHHISVLDRYASASIVRSTSKSVGLGLIIRISSLIAPDSPAKHTRNARKSAIDIIDEVEGQSSTTIPQVGGSGELHLELFVIDECDGEIRIKALSSTNLLRMLHVSDAKEVKDITLYHSGRLALLTSKGLLLSFTLKLLPDCTLVSGAVTAISLPLLAQQSLVRLSSLQLVTSTTALVVVGRPFESTISTILVDLDLACVLAESSWPVKGVGSTFVHRVAGSTALVVATRVDDTSKVGATLWTLPYEASEDGHLRWALASSVLSKKWIGLEKHKETHDEAETARKHLIKELERIAIDKKGEEAATATDAACEKWHKKETSRLEALWVAKVGKEAALDEDGSSDSDAGKHASLGKGKVERKHKQKGAKGKPPGPAFPQVFVTQLVDYALPSTSASETSSNTKGYARQTMHHLLTQHAISISTRPDLLPCLLAVDDWDAITKALRFVNDLPEHDIVDVLLQAVRRKNSGPSDIKKLESFLNIFASVALNRSQLRVALKSKIEEVDDIIAIFDVLCSWLDRTQEELLEDFIISDANGAAKKKGRKSRLPEVDQILALLCDLMDTYFPLFLSTSSTHEHLQRLSKQINAHLVVYNQLLILRGPLAAFSRLESDRKKEAAALEARKTQARTDAEDKMMSLRISNKKAVHGKNNVIGEVGGGLGKGVLGEKSRRRQMYEENVAVGLYSLERLEL